MPGSYRASIGHNPLIRVKKQLVGLVGRDITLTPGTGGVANPFLSDGFEDGTLNAWNESSTSGSAFAVITGGAANGTRYLRTTLTYASSSTYRAEHALKSSGGRTQGVPYYYGFSLRVPATTLNDAALTDTITQWHPNGGGAHWALRNDNGVWGLEAHNLPAGGDGNMGVIVKDVWHRWVYRWVWSDSAAGGSVKAWLNPTSEASTAVHTVTGIRTVPTGFGTIMNWKTGCYKPGWQFNAPAAGISPRIYHEDDFRIGLAFVDAL